MAIDAVQALYDADPDFPFADYDVEDQGDLDGDGNLFEPDGVLDHVVVIHAGADQADDGGVQGTYAEWSSSQVVDPTTGGYEVPGTGREGLQLHHPARGRRRRRDLARVRPRPRPARPLRLDRSRPTPTSAGGT